MTSQFSYPKLSKRRFMSMLTSEEVRDIHAASLDILEQVGISTNSQRIIDIFRQNGADVQPGGLIKIPNRLVEEALKKTPKEVRLYGRDPKNELVLENGRVYFGLGGTPLPKILDLDSGMSRPSTKKDVAEETRLGDALPNMAFIMSIGGALDVIPRQAEFLHELEVVFANTEKCIVWALPGTLTAKQAIVMASAVIGSQDELRKKPILACYSESISPLNFSTDNEDLIEFASAGMPVFFTGNPILGLTGPATMSGAYALGNAETLAALTLSQLINPGNPFVYGSGCGSADLRNLRFSFASPEWALGHILQSQLADFYQIPTFGWGGSSDSKCVDAQAGAEATFMSMMSALSGINMIHCCGMMAGSDYGSMELAVICDEIAAWIYRLFEETHVDKESLALDVIREVGHKGNYLIRQHTHTHLRKEVFVPTLFDRNNESTWAEKGRKNIQEVAKERVLKLLREHHPRPLAEDTKATLARIVRETERLW